MTIAPRVAVGAVVVEIRSDGPYVLIARRGVAPNAGRWSLPGGKVEAGESLTAALVREVKEETGLDVIVGKFLDVVEIIDDAFHFVILDYACMPCGGELVAGDDVSEVCFVAAYDIADYDLTPAVRRMISMAISDDGRE